MLNARVELQGKCRRLFYAKVAFGYTVAGDVLGVASAGGAIEQLTGDALIIATFNSPSAPERIGCIEAYYSPIPANRPLRVDLTEIGACDTAVDNLRAAKQAEADFVFETGIRLFGSEPTSMPALRRSLDVAEIQGREAGLPGHDAITLAQTALQGLSAICLDCCEQLLITRDAAVTFVV